MIQIHLTKTRITTVLILLPWVKLSFKMYIHLRQYLRLKTWLKCPEELTNPNTGRKAILTQTEYDEARKNALENFSFDVMPEVCTACNISLQIYFRIPRKIWHVVSFFNRGNNTTSFINLFVLSAISLGGTTVCLLVTSKKEKKLKFLAILKSKTFAMAQLYIQFLNNKYSNNKFLVAAGISFLVYRISGTYFMNWLRHNRVASWLKNKQELAKEVKTMAQELNVNMSEIVIDIVEPWHIKIGNVDLLSNKIIVPFKVFDKGSDQEIFVSILHYLAHRKYHHKYIKLIVDLASMGLGTFLCSSLFHNELMHDAIDIEESIVQIYIEYETFQQTYNYFKEVFTNYLNQRLEYEADYLLVQYNKQEKILDLLEKQMDKMQFSFNFALYDAAITEMPSPQKRMVIIEQSISNSVL